MRSDTTPSGPRDLPRIWAQLRGSVVGLFRGLDPTALSTPALQVSPDKTVMDTFARAFDVEGSGCTDLSSAAQAWLAALHPDDPEVLTARIVTTVGLEHDIRCALDMPGSRDTAAVKLALDFLSDGLSERCQSAGLAPLRVTVEQWGTIAGDGPASRCVVADRFDFVRAMQGRRSEAQVRRWNWGTDPSPYLLVLWQGGRLPADDVRERDPRIPAEMVEFDITGVRSDPQVVKAPPRRMDRIVYGG